MRIVLLHNPRSGRGGTRNHAAIGLLRRTLAAEGIEVIDATPTDAGALSAKLAGASALVIAGGDGSVHHAAPIAIAANIPIYHFPLGTENLFARECGSRPCAQTLVRLLRAGRTRTIDAATCNGRTFVLMASIGFDASVVRSVAAARRAGVTRFDYIRRGLGELAIHRPPRLSIATEHGPMAEGEPGLVIVASSPHYAARLNPCSRARAFDGLLDVLFLPFDSRIGLVRWAGAIGMRRHMNDPAARIATARAVTIRSDSPSAALQLDGESVASPIDGIAVDIRIQPACLRVLSSDGD